MAVSLVNINRWLCSNFAGIKSLRIILPEDVDSLPEALAVPNIEGDITLLPGKEMYTVQFDPGSSRFRESLQSNNRNGDFYNRELSFTVRRLRVNIADFRRRLLNRRVHLFFTDNNDETYLFAFMRLRQAEADSAQRGGRNETSFTFQGGSAEPASFVGGTLVDDPGGEDDKVIVNGVNGQTYCLIVGPCGELITVPIITEDPNDDVVVGGWTISTGENNELQTTQDG